MSQARSAIKRLLEATSSTETTWPFIGPTLAICGALLWGSAMVFASMYARLPVPSPSAKVFLVFLGAVAGLFIACGAFGTPKRHLVIWMGIFAGGLLAGGACVLTMGVGGVTRIADDARRAFLDERHEFATSAAGFPYLAGTAKEFWNVDLEIDNVELAPASLAESESDGSAATSDVHAGFCVLRLQPRMAERYIGVLESSEYRQDILWVAAARQVGRCLDLSRDEIGTPRTDGTLRSISPTDAFGIKSVHDYFAATQSASTRAWRASFEDAFAVGWMRLVKPDYARQLADTMRHQQQLAGDGDVAAQCAVQTAMKANQPASLADLPRWADAVRTAGCRQ